MKKSLFILFMTFLSAGSLWSQCVYTCSNYAVSPITYTTFPTGPTNVTPSFTNSFLGTFADDGSIGPIPIGFNFDFYCTTYTAVHICSNGFIMLDYQAFPWPTQYVHPTQSLPSPTLPNGMIAFNMTDLDPGQGGTITYTTVGVAPNRMFIVTYSNVPCFSAPSDLNTGQIVLYETTNMIEIHTTTAKPDINQGTLGSTQGIENTTGSSGVTPPGRNANNSWGGSSASNTAYQFGPYTPAPPSSLTGSTLLCQGDPTSYQASFITSATGYVWTLPPGWLGTSTLSALTTTSGASGSLSVSATYTCGTSVPVTINVSVTAAPIVSIGQPSPGVICAGKTVTLNTSGAVTYTIYPGGMNGVPTFTDMPLTTTVYSVVGTSSLGCISVNNPTVSVIVKDTPVISINSGSMCLGETFSFTPSGANTYSLNGSFFFSTVSPTLAGQYTYSITGTGTNLCVSDPVLSTVTIYSLPVIGAAATRTSICLKESVPVIATGGVSYVWGNASTNTTITVSPTTNTFYTVTGTDIHGCKNTATANVSVKPCTGIEELSGGMDIKIYPNPTNGIFEVRLISVNDKAQIEIYNAIGQLITMEPVLSEVTGINLKNYSNGVYYVKVKNAGYEHTVKVIKQ